MSVKNILILAANPKDTQSLALPEEIRQIEEAIERSRGRDQFNVVTCLAVRPDDLRRSLLKHSPHIVHFSGHGTGQSGIAVETHNGLSHLISTQALRNKD